MTKDIVGGIARRRNPWALQFDMVPACLLGRFPCLSCSKLVRTCMLMFLLLILVMMSRTSEARKSVSLSDYQHTADSRVDVVEKTIRPDLGHQCRCR